MTRTLAIAHPWARASLIRRPDGLSLDIEVLCKKILQFFTSKWFYPLLPCIRQKNPANSSSVQNLPLYLHQFHHIAGVPKETSTYLQAVCLWRMVSFSYTILRYPEAIRQDGGLSLLLPRRAIAGGLVTGRCLKRIVLEKHHSQLTYRL